MLCISNKQLSTYVYNQPVCGHFTECWNSSEGMANFNSLQQTFYGFEFSCWTAEILYNEEIFLTFFCRDFAKG